MSSDLLTVVEAAEYLRAHPVTVRRWALEGRIPALRVGGRYRFRRQELDEWMAAGRPQRREGSP